MDFFFFNSEIYDTLWKKVRSIFAVLVKTWNQISVDFLESATISKNLIKKTRSIMNPSMSLNLRNNSEQTYTRIVALKGIDRNTKFGMMRWNQQFTMKRSDAMRKTPIINVRNSWQGSRSVDVISPHFLFYQNFNFTFRYCRLTHLFVHQMKWTIHHFGFAVFSLVFSLSLSSSP